MHEEEALAAKELEEEVLVQVRLGGERADDLLPPEAMENTARRDGSPCGRAFGDVTS